MLPFELTILGCSSATPTTNRNPSAQFLNVNDRYFLIDCGEGTQVQLRKYKLRFQKIDHVLISHLHGDHFLGLAGLLQSMHLLGRENVLNIYGPPELQEHLLLVNRVSQTTLRYPINFISTKTNGKNLLFEDERVKVYSFPLNHRIACTGFVFEEKEFERKIDKKILADLNISYSEIHKLKQGFDVSDNDGKIISNKDATLNPPKPRSFAYCSDTAYFEDIVEHVAGVNLMYHEATFLEEMRKRADETYHSTALDAGKIALKCNVDQLIIGHFSARYPKAEVLLNECKTVFDNTLLAEEGKKFEINLTKEL